MAFFGRFPGFNTFLKEVFQYCVILLEVDVKCGMLTSCFALNYSRCQESNSCIIIVNIYIQYYSSYFLGVLRIIADLLLQQAYEASG